MKAVLSK